jgi:hypothetical protein
MNLRLTPLNIVSSLLLVGTAYSLIYPSATDRAYPGILSLLIMFVLCIITDITFRRLIINIKRIWLFELLFIIFVSVSILLILSVFR